MATIQTGSMTAEEFFEWANRTENRDRNCELVHGEIVEMTRPGKRHGFVCANVVRVLWQYAGQRRKGYVCANDTGVIVERDPDTVRGPDVMFFDDVESVDQIDRKFGEQPPRLAVEVLSPSDSMGKMMRRITDQLRFGTPLVWVVDPEVNNVTVYRPAKEPYVVENAGELTGEDILPGLCCPVRDFFALPGQ